MKHFLQCLFEKFNLSYQPKMFFPQVFSQYEIILRLQQSDSKMLLKCIPLVQYGGVVCMWLRQDSPEKGKRYVPL